MKTFTRLLLCFLLLTVSKAIAQETFAPLITENTIIFVHVDFSKVDIDTLKAEITTASETLLQTLGFDARSQRATLRDLELELEKLDILVRPTFDTITKELGIRELAIIANLSFEHGVGTTIAVPWKDKTNEHLETFF